MTTLEQLQEAVEAAFTLTSHESPPWPDPHPDHANKPSDSYSRLTNPARWRIMRARTDAWLVAVTRSGLANVEPDAGINWRTPPRPTITSSERVIPVAVGALELVFAHSRIGDIDDAGVCIGIGNPAVFLEWFPHCGCDACDSGSQNELDHLDNHLVGIIAGRLRLLTKGTQSITVLNHDSWSASGFPGRQVGGQVETVLADPSGWTDVSGTPWLDIES